MASPALAFSHEAAPAPVSAPPAGPSTGPAAGPPVAADDTLNRVAKTATALGREIVEIGGVLTHVDQSAREQIALLQTMRAETGQIRDTTLAMGESGAALAEAAARTNEVVEASIALLSASSGRSREISEWVTGLAGRMGAFGSELEKLGTSNQQIADIARHVRMLAINAKIEAARAGANGLGFGVVAEEIGALADKTTAAAEAISDELGTLKERIGGIKGESAQIAEQASAVLTEAGQTDQALGDMAESARRSASAATEIATQSARQRSLVEGFLPEFARIDNAVQDAAEGITRAHHSTSSLIDLSESLVQQTAILGGVSAETVFIERVQQAAAEVSALFETALARGEITEAQLFARDYRPLPGTDPAQAMAPFTAFTDRHLPAIQEPVLDLDKRVVFCAAINLDGYLPTHNLKFSHPQGDDPVWNATNCRNRRIFDDRVGLKAGQSTAPFLLQVYRRDMGGGTHVIMKDVSAPVFVRGRHWGGVRMGYGF